MQKVKQYLIVGGVLLLILSTSFLLGRCSTKKERTEQIANIVAARDSLEEFSVTIGGLNNFVALKNAIILDQKEAIKAGIIERDRLKVLHIKDLVTNAELQGIIQILRDSLNLPPDVLFITTTEDTTGLLRDYARVPFTLLKEHDQYLSLNAGMDKNRKAWFELSVPVSGEISIGYMKTGFLKTKAVGIFTSKNPYLNVTNMDVLIVKDKKKIYQKTWFEMLSGAAIFETGRQLLKRF